MESSRIGANPDSSFTGRPTPFVVWS
jgi:hypothetical protein